MTALRVVITEFLVKNLDIMFKQFMQWSGQKLKSMNRTVVRTWAIFVNV